MTDPQADEYRSFSLFLADLCEGEANKELTETLDALMALMRDRSLDVNAQVKGSITLKLNLTCDPRGVVGCGFDVKHTDPPKPKSAAGIYWMTKNDKLTARNPRQQVLALHDVAQRPAIEVPSSTTPAKEV